MKMKLIVIFTIVAVIFGESAWATLEDQSKGPTHSSISSPTSTPKSTTSNTTKTSTTETTKATTTAKTTTKSTSKTSTKATTTAKATTTKATTTAKATTTKATTTAKATTTKATTTAKATTTKATTTAKATTTKATTTAKATTKSTSKTPTKESTTTAKATTKSTSKTPTTMTTPTKPTEHPTPTSPPSHGKFSLKENNSYCILAEFAAIFTITYVEKGSSSSTTPTKATTTAIPTTKSTSKTPTKATTTAKPPAKSNSKTPTKESTTTAKATTKSTSKTPTKESTTTAKATTKSTSKTPTKATTTAKATTKPTSKTKEVHLDSSSHAVVTGTCGTNTTNASLKISWPKKEKFYTLVMEFQKSSSSHKWTVISIMFNVTVEGNPAFKNITDVGKHVISVYNGSAVPHGQLGGDYRCENAPSITFKNNEMHFGVKSAFTDMRIEPFVHKTKAGDFDKHGTVECQSDHTTSPPTTSKPSDNVVPIAVGCALAGLVLIVLIAYVIGRRKSPSGYEKV